MILRSLQIDRFGTWKDLRISHLEDGVHLFYGPNETGKTTLMQFIRMVFYGLNTTRLAYLSAEHPEQFGGTLTFSEGEETYRVTRHTFEYFSEATSPLENDLPYYARTDFQSRFLTRRFEDGLEIRTADGERADALVLRSRLGLSATEEVDETLFSHVFSVGLQDLQRLSALDSTEAASRLYQLSTGMARHSLLRILRQLEDDRWTLLRPDDRMELLRPADGEGIPRGRWGCILRLIQRREQLLQSLEDLRGRNEAYAKTARDKVALEAEIAEAEEQLRQKNHLLRTYELADLLRETWQKRAETDEQIVAFTSEAGLAETSEATSAAIETLREVEAKLRRFRETAAQAGERQAACRKQMAALQTQRRKESGSPVFARAIPQIESLLPQEEWRETLRARRENLGRTLRDTEAQLTMDYRRLGLEVPQFTAEPFTLTVPSLRTLKVPFRETRKLAQKMREARMQEADFLERAEALDAPVQAYFAAHPEVELAESTETPTESGAAQAAAQWARKLGDGAAGLRRRERNLQQLQQAWETCRTLETELETIRAARNVSPWGMAVLGTVFVTGLTLTLFESLRLSGVFPPASYGASLVGFLLGTLAWLGCGVGHTAFRRKNRAKEETAQRNWNAARTQVRQRIPIAFPNEESHEEDALADIALDQKVEQALEETQAERTQREAELAKAESIAVQASERDALRREMRHYANRFRKLRNDWREAVVRRKAALRNLGLPTEWKAQNVAALLEASDRLRELWRRHARDAEDDTQYAQELAALTERIQDVLQAADVEMSADAPEVFSVLREKIRKEDQLREQRRELGRQYRILQREVRQLQETRRKLRRAYRHLLGRSELVNEAAIPKRREQLETLLALRQTRRELQREIDSTLDFTCPETTLWDLYERMTPSQIQDKQKILSLGIEEKQFQLESLRKRATTADTTLRQWAADRTPVQLRYDLARTEQQILQAIHFWRTSAMTARLVETVKRTYEQRRQPETLERTSTFFEEMTDGKYRRIWTPVEEDVLYAERNDGRIFSVDQLSSGTRELLFLAIRLALVVGYQAQGLRLPLILDDVLVNLDATRAARTAEILCRFADETESQILLFTAHDSIRNLFAENDVPIANL